MKEKLLTLEQLDEQLLPLKKEMPIVPHSGWVRTLRQSLGLTIAQLAKRLGVVPSRIIKIESAETTGAITIQTLQSVAETMNCRFVYALVPKDSLTHEILNRADKLASEQLSHIAHTMKLENQLVKAHLLKKHREQLKNQLLSRSWKHLWRT